MFIATSNPLPAGSVVALAFVTDGDKGEIKAEAEVVHRTPTGMGMRFLRIGQKDARRLRRFVAEMTSILGHRETAARLHDVASRVSEPIGDPDRIQRLLEEARERGVDYTVIPGDRPLRESARLRAVNAGGLELVFKEASELVAEENVFVLCTLDFVSYSFQARVLAVDGASARLSLPAAIHYSERRSSKREAEDSATLSVPVPWADGQTLSWPVCEVSPGGLSFRALPNELHLMAGTPLANATLTRGGQTIPLEGAIVKHLTLMDAQRDDKDGLSPWLKVGVAHGAVRGERRVEEIRVSGDRDAPKGAWSRLASWGRGLTTKTALLYHQQFGALRGNEGTKPFEVVRFANRAGKEIVGLLNLSSSESPRVRAPLVIVLPGYGARKETLTGLAAMIIHNFRHEYRDVAVLRIDSTNNLGESEKDAGCSEDGRNNLHYTVTGGVDDLLGALEWARSNRFVEPTDIVVISTSFSSIAARRALTLPEARDVSRWIAFMGAADAQNAILHVSGHIDIYGNYVRGIRNGVVTLFGCMVDADSFARDLERTKVGTLEDARRDMAKIEADVTWICGKHDAWMDPRRVGDIMSIKAAGAREVVEVDSGHLPRSSEEGLAQFSLITRRLWRHLYGRDIQPKRPSDGWIAALSAREWQRVARTSLEKPADYWRTYLLGKDGIGFDVLNYSPAYKELVDLQVQLAAPEGKRVLDLGAGTGNVTKALSQASPRQLVSADIVADALTALRKKVNGFPVETVVADADGNPWIAMRRWMQGELPGIKSLSGRIPGVAPQLFDHFAANESSKVHALLRGAQIDVAGVIKDIRVPAQHAGAAADLHRFARAVSGREPVETASRGMTRLRPDALFSQRPLPFANASFDAVVMNLVLSYMRYPADCLSEVFRVLAPGGIFVVSSMRRDADSSKLFMDLISYLQAADPSSLDDEKEKLVASARELVNSAAELLRLEEEGIFRFFDGPELAAIVTEAGFEDARITPSFGVPPQAVVVSCRRP